jgi:hypothetical protein
VQRQQCDPLTIKNFEALRLMATAIQLEKAEDWQNAMVNQQSAVKVLDEELKQYLGGVAHVMNVDMGDFGMGSLGEPL